MPLVTIWSPTNCRHLSVAVGDWQRRLSIVAAYLLVFGAGRQRPSTPDRRQFRILHGAGRHVPIIGGGTLVGSGALTAKVQDTSVQRTGRTAPTRRLWHAHSPGSVQARCHVEAPTPHNRRNEAALATSQPRGCPRGAQLRDDRLLERGPTLSDDLSCASKSSMVSHPLPVPAPIAADGRAAARASSGCLPDRHAVGPPPRLPHCQTLALATRASISASA